MTTRLSTPVMPTPWKIARTVAGRIRRRVRDWQRGETKQTTFDLTNLREFNDAVTPLGVEAWVRGTAQANRDELGATRFVLTEYATLRRKFPRGLSERDALRDHLCRTHGLTPAGVANVTAAFDGHRGERVKRVYDMREDLRAVFLFGLTPHPIRIDYVHWFLHHGIPQYGLTLEEVVWSLYEEDEATDRGLVTTYLATPAWQRDCPDALTVFGWDRFKAYLAREHGLAGQWFENATRTPCMRPWDELTILRRTRTGDDFPRAAAERGDADAVVGWVRARRLDATPGPAWFAGLCEDIASGLPAVPGVNLVGHFRYQSGLQEAALGVNRALKAAGSRTTLRELPVTHACDWTEPERFRGVELFDTTIFLAAANTLPHAWIPRAGVHWRPEVTRIAYWYWELEELPAAWHGDMQWPDEVWAPTAFLAETYRKVVRVPVVPMLPGVELPAFVRQPRTHFGLPAERFLFLFSFDMNSLIARKNPHAVLAAFRRAFAPSDAAHLVLKISRGSTQPAELARLQLAAAGANVTIINATLTRSDTLALLDLADCYTSLHRAEGLGLGMAESMLLGKPVIATNYSGNTDFMTADTAYLVDSDLAVVGPGLFPYPEGAHWAEARVEHAAALMRRVFDDPAAARATGERARVHATTVLDPKKFGEKMTARLAAGRRSAE